MISASADPSRRTAGLLCLFVRHVGQVVGAPGRRPAREVSWLLGVIALVFALVGQPALWWQPHAQLLGVRPPDVLGSVLVVLIAVPLAAADRRPRTAVAVSAAALLSYAALGYPASPADLATLGLLVWVVAVQPLAVAAVVTGTLVVGSVVAGLLRPGVHTLAEYAGAVLAPGIAALVGLVVRAQRQRAALARREQDLALREARLAAERAAAGERLRIARTVHDAVGHGVTLITLQVQAADRLLATDPRRARLLLADAAGHGRAAMVELQRLLGVLSPSAEASEAAVGDLPEIAGRFDRAGLSTTFTADGVGIPLPPGLSGAAAAILTEALSNVARHAAARQAQVRLSAAGDAVVLDVLDDGRGLEGAAFGHGLRGAADRATALGGHLQVGPGPAGGTLLRAVLPRHPTPGAPG